MISPIQKTAFQKHYSPLSVCTYFCSLLLFFLCAQPVFSQEDFVAIPKLSSQVTDLTGTLSTTERAELTRMLHVFREKKGAEVVLLMLPTTKPETIETFGIRLAEQWKIGRKKIDDGAILIVAKNDRRLRIEVGYGLEGALTDIMSDHIIRTIITPLFKKGAFYQGVKNGLLAITRVIDGEELPGYQKKISFGGGRKKGSGLIFFLVLFVIAGALIRSWLGSGVAFVVNLILGIICGYLFLNLLSGVLTALFATLISSRSMGGSLGMMGMMGMGGGYHGGGGGGGGFSGGGGGFGGGGSSGGW